MSGIERRYSRLLLAYPRWYRDELADEMLGTLLEAADPDRSRPSFRDVRALVLDVRPMLAVAITMAIEFGSFSIVVARFDVERLVVLWPWAGFAAVSAVLAIVAIMRVRRQAAL